jgi:ATP-dependent 26S proteasome regulatory subunit
MQPTSKSDLERLIVKDVKESNNRLLSLVDNSKNFTDILDELDKFVTPEFKTKLLKSEKFNGWGGIQEVASKCYEKPTGSKIVVQLMIKENISILDALKALLLYKEARTTSGPNEGGSVDMTLQQQPEPANEFDGVTSVTGPIADRIESAFVMSRKFPCLYKQKKMKPFLMFGPPGSGKTYSVKEIVVYLQRELHLYLDQEPRINLFLATGASMKGKYVGETEKNIRSYFESANRAAGEKGLSVLFIDEFDAIASSRLISNDSGSASAVTELLQTLDGVKQYKNVLTIAATNYPWVLDAAILSRFTNSLFVDVPTKMN